MISSFIIRKRSAINIVLVIILFILTIITYGLHDKSFASSSNKQTILGKRTIHFADYYADYDEEDSTHSSSSVTLHFRTNRKMIFMVPIKITVDTDDALFVSKGGIRVILQNNKGDVLQNDFISLKGYGNGDVHETWLYSDGFFHSAGTYTYTIQWSADEDCDVECSVIGYTKFAKKAKFKKKASKRSGNWVKIGKIKGGLPYIKKFKTTNKKAIPAVDVASNGNVYAYALGKGTAKVTITLKNGKKYSTRITVKPGDPNMFASVYNYVTRDNYFVVKVKNNSPHSITIIKSGGKVEHVDYKSFDRNIKSGASVTIKPGKTKYVRFYLSGSNTWYDSSEYTLYARFRYEGKTYEWHVWDSNSVYKKNKKWHTTYWNSNQYEDWNETE